LAAPSSANRAVIGSPASGPRRFPNSMSRSTKYRPTSRRPCTGSALEGIDTERLAERHTRVGLRVCYEHTTNTADVIIEPVIQVNSECPRRD
jgi:hypothetical protein